MDISTVISINISYGVMPTVDYSILTDNAGNQITDNNNNLIYVK